MPAFNSETRESKFAEGGHRAAREAGALSSENRQRHNVRFTTGDECGREKRDRDQKPENWKRKRPKRHLGQHRGAK